MAALNAIPVGHSPTRPTDKLVRWIDQHTRIHDACRVHDGLGARQCLTHELGHLLFIRRSVVPTNRVVVRAGATMADHGGVTGCLDVLGPTPSSLDALEAGVHDYIRYFNNERIKLGLKGLSPVDTG